MPEDGSVNSSDLAQAFVKGAVQQGDLTCRRELSLCRTCYYAHDSVMLVVVSLLSVVRLL